MQYILNEDEYLELKKRPTQFEFDHLNAQYKQVILHFSDSSKPCKKGNGYCDGCVVSELRVPCPFPDLKDFSK
jgi:hypothetical protein